MILPKRLFGLQEKVAEEEKQRQSSAKGTARS
jgi:hypothetical protein